MENKKIYTKEVIKDKDENCAFIVRDLFSCEHKKNSKNELVPLLNGITFNIQKNDIIGISSIDRDELYILIEILGNMRSYYKGYIKLSSLGTKAKKRSLVESIFYVDSYSMLYESMNVLEHLMYIGLIKKNKCDPGVLQKEMLDIIKATGLEKYVVSRIKDLSDNMKMVIAILISSLSDSEKIVINAIKYIFTYEEACIIDKIFKYYNDKGKTIVFASMDYKTIGMACNKVMYISNGKVQTCAPVQTIYKEWDKVTCAFKTDKPNELVSLINLLNRNENVECYAEGGFLYVKYIDVYKLLSANFLQSAKNNKIEIEQIKINSGRISNAFEEIEASINDLHK